MSKINKTQKSKKAMTPLLVIISIFTATSLTLLPAFSSSEETNTPSKSIVQTSNTTGESNAIELGDASQVIRIQEAPNMVEETKSTPRSTSSASTVKPNQVISNSLSTIDTAPTVADGEVVIGDAIRVARS